VEVILNCCGKAKLVDTAISCYFFIIIVISIKIPFHARLAYTYGWKRRPLWSNWITVPVGL